VFRHLLCPVDFSSSSPRAVLAAADCARTWGASITTLYVSPPALTVAGDFAYMTEPAPLSSAMRRRVVWQLEELWAPLRDGLRLRIEVAQGDPASEILSRCSPGGVDLVVMGTHSRSRLVRWLLGSVTAQVLREARVPVLTVSPEARTSLYPYRTVLCAESLSRPSRALEYARALRPARDGHVIVLHAVEELPEDWEPGRAPFEHGRQLIAEATARLAAEVGDLAREQVDVVVVPGRAAEAIVRFAAQCAVDLVVVGVHDGHVVERTLLGSTALHVVEEAGCPVLAVRGEGVRSLVRRADERLILQGAE
jgi:nucleotide-binding universal stress UspA family protein